MKKKHPNDTTGETRGHKSTSIEIIKQLFDDAIRKPNAITGGTNCICLNFYQYYTYSYFTIFFPTPFGSRYLKEANKTQ